VVTVAIPDLFSACAQLTFLVSGRRPVRGWLQARDLLVAGASVLFSMWVNFSAVYQGPGRRAVRHHPVRGPQRPPRAGRPDPAAGGQPARRHSRASARADLDQVKADEERQTTYSASRPPSVYSRVRSSAAAPSGASTVTSAACRSSAGASSLRTAIRAVPIPRAANWSRARNAARSPMSSPR
jgi:hypothetical protein